MGSGCLYVSVCNRKCRDLAHLSLIGRNMAWWTQYEESRIGSADDVEALNGCCNTWGRQGN